MKSDIQILMLLLDRKEERFTIKKIAETLKINYRIAYEKVAALEKEGLIKVSRAGNSKLCEFANKFNNKVYEAEYQRRMSLFKNKDFLVIRNMLAELDFSFIAMLFGSYAKGTSNKHSDIDILAIGGDGKEIESVLSLFPGKIHLIHISFKDFIHMLKSKEFTVVSEATKNNIILIGIEDYYRVMQNANR